VAKVPINIKIDAKAAEAKLKKLVDDLKQHGLPGGKPKVKVPVVDTGTGKPVLLELPKKAWDELMSQVAAKDLVKDEDEAFIKAVADAFDGKGVETVGYGNATTGPQTTLTSSALESAYQEIKEFVAKHPPPKLVMPKAPHTMGMDFGSGESSSVMGLHILNSDLVPKGQLFMLGETMVMAKNIGKQEKPATMDSSPKKGINVKEFPIYRFGPVNEGNASMKDVLGGKGANLAEMASMGFPVPPGYTLPCEFSVNFLHGSYEYQKGFLESVKAHVMAGDQYLFEQFGFHPLVSVRSGAPVSMPGMMDTILNVGINDENLEEWKKRIGERAALDSYRRFLQMYGATALSIDHGAFEDALADIKAAAKVKGDSELDASFLARLIKRYKDIYADWNQKVPETRQDAIMGSIEAVFRSWNSPRAQAYRADNKLSFEMGTAVNVQAMVFGNMNDKSCSGVAFTRDKANGVGNPTGDFLVNAQGEEVVAGTRTPEPLHKMKAWNSKVFYELLELMKKLEQHYKDMQDVEFTVQDGKLFMLQTRTAKRSALAAFRVAHDMVEEGLISKDEALKRVKRAQLLEILKPSIDPTFKGEPIAKGLPVGGSVVSGKAVFSSDAAIACNKNGQRAILIRKETDPDDYMGIKASVGVLTATGGPTAHAAVVCNGLDKPCVVGCEAVKMLSPTTANIGKQLVVTGDIVSIDGSTGNVYLGEVPVKEPQITKEVRAIAAWFSKAQRSYRVTGDKVADLIAQIVDAPDWVKVVHIDTCGIKKIEGYLSILGQYLGEEEQTGRTFVLDLSGPDGSYGKCDRAVNRMFGLKPGALDDADLKATELLQWEPAAVACTVVKTPKSCTMADQLRWKGFKVMGAVKTVEDLLKGDGPAIIDDETVLKVFGSKEALQFVQDAMAKAGKAPSKPVPEPEYWWEPLMREGA
jgi:phosphohistidine swiveling domain-containing protein